MTVEGSFYDEMDNCISVLKKINSSMKFCLQIEGYMTDGGTYTNNPIFDVYNAFIDTHDKVYSSK